MTAIMQLPGILTSVPPGMEEAILLEPSGLVSRDLEALFLFEEGSGTVLEDAQGGASGTIDSLASSNNAFSRLSGGGVQLSGAQLGSFPAFDGASAWTLFAACRVVNHTGSAGTEKIAGLIGSRSLGAAPIRGAYLFQRGATNLSAASANAFYQHRSSDGAGGLAQSESLTPVNLNTFDLPRLAIISYNGTDAIESRIVDRAGATIAADTLAATDSQLWTAGGTTAANQQWVIGGLSSTYGGGVVQYEFSARYRRALSDFSAVEIKHIAAAAAAIGTGRGRS